MAGRIGACCNVVVVQKDHIICANAGDCRAVIARRSAADSNACTAFPVSHDHNAARKREQLELEKEHPGESDVFVCKRSDICYVKGRLQPTRGFGDFYLKTAEFNVPASVFPPPPAPPAHPAPPLLRPPPLSLPTKGAQ